MNSPRIERKNATHSAKKTGAIKASNAAQVTHYDTTPQYSLASQAGRAAVAKLQAEFAANPEKSTAFFKAAGILTSKGRLAKRYGG